MSANDAAAATAAHSTAIQIKEIPCDTAGYRLTTEIRNDPRLRGLYVVLHTSLSGSFNDSMVKKVGCDNFLSKFQPDKLVDVVRERLMLDEVPA